LGITSLSPLLARLRSVVGGLVYVTYKVEMAGYDDFHKCNRQSTMTRFEWVLRFRLAEDCRHY